MSVHTPGPWWIGDDDGYIYGPAPDNFTIAAVLDDANARLIAAAPALLEALEIAERDIAAMSPSFGYEYTSLATVRAAIAQAKGEG